MKKIKKFFIKLKELLSKIDRDKFTQFIIGSFIAIVVLCVISLCTTLSYGGVIATLILSSLIVISKDIYDRCHRIVEANSTRIFYSFIGVLFMCLLFLIIV